VVEAGSVAVEELPEERLLAIDGFEEFDARGVPEFVVGPPEGAGLAFLLDEPLAAEQGEERLGVGNRVDGDADVIDPDGRLVGHSRIWVVPWR
jgi:hypothetical protein